MGCVFLGEPLTSVRVTGMALVGGSMLVASIPWDKRKPRRDWGEPGFRNDRCGKEGDWEGIASRSVDV